MKNLWIFKFDKHPLKNTLNFIPIKNKELELKQYKDGYSLIQNNNAILFFAYVM